MISLPYTVLRSNWRRIADVCGAVAVCASGLFLVGSFGSQDDLVRAFCLGAFSTALLGGTGVFATTRLSLSIERQRLVKRRRETVAMLAQLAEASPVLTAYVDDELRYQLVNQAYARALGQDVTSLVGRSVSHDWFNNPLSEVDPLNQVALGNTVQFRRSVVVDNVQRFYDTTLTPRLDEDGKPVGFFDASLDVTATRLPLVDINEPTNKDPMAASKKRSQRRAQSRVKRRALPNGGRARAYRYRSHGRRWCAC